MEQQSPTTTPPQQHPETPPAAAAMPLQSALKSGRKRWLLLVIPLVIVIAGIAWFFATRNQGISRINSAGIDSLAAKSNITASDVAALDKTEAFYAYLKNAAQQPKLVVTTSHYRAPSSASTTRDATTNEITGYNYITKAFTHAEDNIDSTGTRKTRCVDGREWLTIVNLVDTWVDKGPANAEGSPCNPQTFPGSLNDGFNTGGLSAGQAAKFAGYLKGQPGLLTVNSVKYILHNGKYYLHFSVTLHPMPVSGQPGNPGLQWLKLAFKKTGLNAATWPYGYVSLGGPFDGADFEYWVDPHTKLPIHSELHKIPGKDTDGTALPDNNYYQYATTYDFTHDTFDVANMKATNADVPYPQ